MAPQVEIYWRLPQESRRFRTVLEAANHNRVVIVEDARETDFVELKSLQSSAFLADRGLDLVLITSAWQEGSSRHLDLQCAHRGTNVGALERQLGGLVDGEPDLVKASGELVSLLDSPALFDRFGKRLAQRWQGGAVEVLARTVARRNYPGGAA